MTELVGVTEHASFTPRRIAIHRIGVRYDSVKVDSGNVDSGSTPTSQLRAGNVLVYKNSADRFVEANDSTGDRSTRPVVSSAEAADTDWDGTTITTYLNGALVSTVVLAGTDDSTSEVVTALNADYAAKNLPLLASGADLAVLVVTCQLAGLGNVLRLESTLATAYANAGGAGSFAEDAGNDADYVVLDEFVDLENRDGTAVHADGRVIRGGGLLDESELINLTVDAKAVLTRRNVAFG